VAGDGARLNAISIDFEDWFCVQNLAHVFDRAKWDELELRADKSTRLLLDAFDRHSTRATFFVLGWLADRLPDLVREIEDRGHEIAVHGYSHQLLTDLEPESFETDLERALAAIAACGVSEAPVGFRAPSFTIVEKTYWAFPVLERHGFRYDSSVFPVGFHPDYGVGDAPLDPYEATDQILEFPLTCAEFFGRRVPCSGGAYFRLFPYSFTKLCLRKVNNQDRPAVFYLHPWELDPGHPRVSLPLTKRLRHYTNLGRTEHRLDKLLDDFRFTTIREVLGV
jgi:polysaccharide deacetylase family protein (PEP-CTERM system associated)